MSTKAPDVIRRPPMPEQGVSLGEMHQLGWTLQGFCRACGVRLKVSLPALIMVHGPDAVWWGRSTPCPAWECAGRLRYTVRAINGGTWVSVTDHPVRAEVMQRWRDARGRPDRGPR